MTEDVRDIANSRKKNIVFVTGTRADYGKLEPLAAAVKKGGFGVTFFVTGMHMLSRYGLTKKEVQKSGFETVEFLNQREDDPQDTILNKTISGFSDYIKESTPDLVVVHGDRVEALSSALVCAMNYILCAHVEGGEVSGTIDELFRHCNTKLAGIHLVCSKEAQRRVLRLGEDSSSVHIIGSPELDIHKRASGVNIHEVRNYYAIDSEEYGICIFHPVTSEKATMKDQAQAFFDALVVSKKYFVVILPNNDPGSEDIVEVISRLPKHYFRVLPSMRFNYFSEMMKNAQVMVGNSSAGVREAPFLGLPSLNVGTRQLNRAAASSITTASPMDSDALLAFLNTEWGNRYMEEAEFGSGYASENFLKLIESDDFWDRPRQKYFCENRDDG